MSATAIAGLTPTQWASIGNTAISTAATQLIAMGLEAAQDLLPQLAGYIPDATQWTIERDDPKTAPERKIQLQRDLDQISESAELAVAIAGVLEETVLENEIKATIATVLDLLVKAAIAAALAAVGL